LEDAEIPLSIFCSLDFFTLGVYCYNIVDTYFEPLLIDKNTFIHYFKDKGLMDIIHGLSWVAESYGILDQLNQNPVNPVLKKRLLDHVIPELKKEPVGEKALRRLTEIEHYIADTNSLDTLEDRFDIILRELSKGYRLLLEQYVPE
jgi:hypothetical protein